jgi:hypothetical protein
VNFGVSINVALISLNTVLVLSCGFAGRNFYQDGGPVLLDEYFGLVKGKSGSLMDIFLK